MRSMATEWAPHNIRVNALCPGYQATQLLQNVMKTEGNLVTQWEKDTPMGRLGNPKELRGSVVFMASEASAFMTGHELVRLKFNLPSTRGSTGADFNTG